MQVIRTPPPLNQRDMALSLSGVLEVVEKESAGAMRSGLLIERSVEEVE